MAKVVPNINSWFELRCRVNAEAYPALEEVLELIGAESITLTDGSGPTSDEDKALTHGGWSNFEVRALFEPTTDRAQLLGRIYDLLPKNMTIGALDIQDRAWDIYWKERWRPRVFASGLCVCPRWRCPPPEAKQVVFIDPGRAFGTGTHETTGLCLDWLASIEELSGATVVDYGCGSGILAIAASHLQAAKVYAVDVDQEALAITRDNATYNRVKILTGLPRLVDGLKVDFLLANILLSTLETLESRFAQLLRQGGQIALSGLLGHQTNQVTEVYREHFRMDPPVGRGEWALLTGHRR